jgi:hypothetical protein
MLRPISRSVTLIVALTASTLPLRAIGLPSIPGAVEGPDGAWVTRSTFPLELVLRPLVLPPGLIVGIVDLDLQASPKVKPNVGLEVAYGLPRGFEIRASGTVLGTENVQLFGRYLITRNAAANLWGEYAFPGSSLSPTSFNTGFGVPLKFTLPRVPIAIGGLDELFLFQRYEYPVEAIFNPLLVAARGGPIARDLTAVWIPAWIEYSPLRILSFEVGGSGFIVTSDSFRNFVIHGLSSPGPLPPTPTTVTFHSTWQGTLEVYGAVALNWTHFELSVTYRHYVYFQTPLAQADYVALAGTIRY